MAPAASVSEASFKSHYQTTCPVLRKRTSIFLRVCVPGERCFTEWYRVATGKTSSVAVLDEPSNTS